MTTLSKLATSNPGAARVFHRYRLDFCCGGGRSLEEACQARGLDPEEILREIEAETPTGGDVDWTERPLMDLIRHIVQRYHEPLHDELVRLLEMARRVEHVHAEKPTCPHGLAAHLAWVREEVENHLAKEEQILFPMIASGAGARGQGPITVMLHEHDDHAANLERTRSLTQDFLPPSEACSTWRALYAGLEALERELMDHIHLENNVLFPRALRGEAA